MRRSTDRTARRDKFPFQLLGRQGRGKDTRGRGGGSWTAEGRPAAGAPPPPGPSLRLCPVPPVHAKDHMSHCGVTPIQALGKPTCCPLSGSRCQRTRICCDVGCDWFAAGRLGLGTVSTSGAWLELWAAGLGLRTIGFFVGSSSFASSGRFRSPVTAAIGIQGQRAHGKRAEAERLEGDVGARRRRPTASSWT